MLFKQESLLMKIIDTLNPQVPELECAKLTLELELTPKIPAQWARQTSNEQGRRSMSMSEKRDESCRVQARKDNGCQGFVFTFCWLKGHQTWYLPDTSAVQGQEHHVFKELRVLFGKRRLYYLTMWGWNTDLKQWYYNTWQHFTKGSVHCADSG